MALRIYQAIYFLILSSIMPFAVASIDSYFSAIKSDPNALYAFFKEMPKGGELHYHLSGGAYPETMLDLASHANYCLDPTTHTIIKMNHCDGVQTSILPTKSDLYQQTIRAWSLMDFVPGAESRQQHFFATFYKFNPIIFDYRPQLLAEIMKRASNQHEFYMEILVLPDDAKSITFGNLISGTTSFAQKQHILLTNKSFQDNIHHTVTESKRILQQARKELGCDTMPKQAVCHLTIKFQYYVLREQPLDNVFAQALNAFAAAQQSSDIVAVNLVQDEGSLVALRDYKAQMAIFKFLHEAYPTVHISLHAGELAPGSVKPDELRFHIHDAIFTGHAQRIGHGIDIARENDAESLLKHMASAPIPVEVNLTSNKKILNVSGKNHPLNYYLAHNVPVVLSTDDEGVLRTDLTSEYVRAVLHHGLDYPTIKTLNRNALTYSFLPGKSIWQDQRHQVLTQECNNLDSITCKQLIDKSEKAKLQWQLEKELSEFEKKW